ncbi:hypothetical protein JXA05_04470, partial [Candidatus Peregrinibacteria bacterium]|nr:hypothetical protein [Candidatus Peregrinibacteria bacterium]
VDSIPPPPPPPKNDDSDTPPPPPDDDSGDNDGIAIAEMGEPEPTEEDSMPEAAIIDDDDDIVTVEAETEEEMEEVFDAPAAPAPITTDKPSVPPPLPPKPPETPEEKEIKKARLYFDQCLEKERSDNPQDRKEAQELAEKARRVMDLIEPQIIQDNADWRILYGMICIHFKNAEFTAERAFRSVLARDPLHAEANFQLAELLLEKNPEQALKHMEKAIITNKDFLEKSPENFVAAWLDYANLLSAKKNITEAKMAFDIAATATVDTLSKNLSPKRKKWGLSEEAPQWQKDLWQKQIDWAKRQFAKLLKAKS